MATVESTSDQVQAIAAASEEQSAASEGNQPFHYGSQRYVQAYTAEAMAEANQAVADLANQAHKLTGLIQEMKNSWQLHISRIKRRAHPGTRF